MPTIRIDDDVLDELRARGTFGDSFNSVVRELLGLPRATRRPAPPGRLLTLLAANLVTDGQVVTWHRRTRQETHRATITGEGRLRTADGRVFTSPGACATALAGYPCAGWREWKTADGTSLLDLQNRLTTTSGTGHQSTR